MSRIKSDKINFGSSIVVDFPSPVNNADNETLEIETSRVNLLEAEAENKIQKMLDRANFEAQSIIDNANLEAQGIKSGAAEELENAKLEAQKILDEARARAIEIETQAQSQAESIKETASQEGAKEGYEAGYTDGKEKIEEELKHKIQDMDDVVLNSFEMKNRILNSSKREIVELVLLIAKKVCINSVDEKSVAKIVNESISLLNDKENIELILSEKYAKLLNSLINGDISDEIEDCEIDIDKLKNIKLTYNSKMADDTIIIQTPKERLDLGFESQINEISRAFLKQLDSNFDEDDGEE